MRSLFVAAFGLLFAACAATPAAAPAPPVRDQKCIDECVHRNQMKAYAIERIESECEDECSAAAAVSPK